MESLAVLKRALAGNGVGKCLHSEQHQLPHILELVSKHQLLYKAAAALMTNSVTNSIQQLAACLA